MRPGGTEKAPKIVIEGPDVNPIIFGMGSHQAASNAPNKRGVMLTIEDAKEEFGANPEYWHPDHVVEIDATPQNIAAVGLSISVDCARARLNGHEGQLHPKSESAAQLERAINNAEVAAASLAKLAGGQDEFEDLLSRFSGQWSSEMKNP